MKKYLIAALFLLGLGARADAKLEKGDHLLAGQLGFAVPIAELDFEGAGNETGGDVYADPGGSIGIQYLYQVTSMLGLGVELTKSNYNERTSSELMNFTVTNSDGDNLDFLAVIRGAFIPHSRVHPFVEGGLGFSRNALKIDARPQPGFVWLDNSGTERRTLVDSSETGAAIMIGGGVDFFVTDRLFIGGGSRLLLYPNREYDRTRSGTQSGLTSVEATLASFNTAFRIGYKF